MIKALAAIATIAYADKKGKKSKKQEVPAIALGANVLASSCYTSEYCVEKARLNYDGARQLTGDTYTINSWVPATNNPGEWL